MPLAPARIARLITPIAVAAAVALTTSGSVAAHPPTSDRPPAPAVTVALEDTGGFAGIHEVISVSRDDDDPRVDTLFQLVERPEFEALASTYLPENTCCDRIFTTLTVTYQDGTAKSVATMAGTPAPDILWQAIDLARAVGTTL